MTTYYEVLRPVTPADLDTRPRFVEVLKLIPSQGHVTSELFRHLGKSRASKGITHACSRGILKRISPHDQILGLNSVKFWLTQLNESGHKNSISKNGTKSLYLQGLKVRCVAAGPLLPVARDGDTRRTDKQAGSHQVVCKHRGDVVLLYRVRLRYQDGTSCRTRIFNKCAGV